MFIIKNNCFAKVVVFFVNQKYIEKNYYEKINEQKLMQNQIFIIIIRKPY